MKTDLDNRTSEHNYTSNSSEVNNNPSLATPNAPELTPDTIANNPMYVVNLEKCINITRQNKRETGNVYQEPADSLKSSAPTLRLCQPLRPAPAPPPVNVALIDLGFQES